MRLCSPAWRFCEWLAAAAGVDQRCDVMPFVRGFRRLNAGTWRLNAEVRLREFSVNGTPKRTKFLAVSQD